MKPASRLFLLVALAMGTGGVVEEFLVRRADAQTLELTRAVSKDRRTWQRLQRERAAASLSAVEAATVDSGILPESGDPTFDRQLGSLLAKVMRFKRWLADHPAEQIPEFTFLSDGDWFEQFADESLHETEAQYKASARGLREQARNTFLQFAVSALRAFAKTEARMPTDLSELSGYFVEAVDDSTLGRYEFTGRGGLADLERAPGDVWIARDFAFGADGIPLLRERESATAGRATDIITVEGIAIEVGSWLPQPSDFAPGSPEARMAEVDNAIAHFERDHRGSFPSDVADLRPYLKDPSILSELKISSDGHGGGSMEMRTEVPDAVPAPGQPAGK